MSKLREANKKIEETMKRSGYDREQIDEALTKAIFENGTEVLINEINSSAINDLGSYLYIKFSFFFIINAIKPPNKINIPNSNVVNRANLILSIYPPIIL